MNVVPRLGYVARFNLVIAILGLTIAARSAAAGAPQPESHTLIGVIWNSRVPQTYASDYLSSVARSHKINHPMLGENYTQHVTNALRQKEKKDELPSRGYAYFLRNQFPPSFVTIGFRTLADQSEFEAQVQQEKKIQPSQFVTVEGAGDKYTLNVIVNNAMMPTFYRWHNGVMFHTQDSNLFTMDLPSAEAFPMPAAEKNRDLIAQFEFDRIPMLLRDMPLMMIRVNAQQQITTENEAQAEFQKALLEYGLSLAKTAFDGARKATLAMTLLHDHRPADLSIDLEVRENSSLAKAIERMATAATRPGMINDGALGTVSLQSGPSEELCAALAAGAKLLRASVEGNENADRIASLLEALAQKPSQLDGFASIGIDPAGEFALYGAISVIDAGLANMKDPVSIDLPGNWFKDCEILASFADVLPTKVNLRVDNSMVWFCLGRAKSADKLKEIIGRKPTAASSKNQFLAIDLQAEPWISDRGAKREAMAHLEKVMAGEAPKGRYRSFLDETLNKNGKAQLSVTVNERDPKQVQLRASVGDGLASFVAARYLQKEHIQLEEQIEEHRGESGAQPRKLNMWLLIFGNLGLVFIVIVLPRLRRKS